MASHYCSQCNFPIRRQVYCLYWGKELHGFCSHEHREAFKKRFGIKSIGQCKNPHGIHEYSEFHNLKNSLPSERNRSCSIGGSPSPDGGGGQFRLSAPRLFSNVSEISCPYCASSELLVEDNRYFCPACREWFSKEGENSD